MLKDAAYPEAAVPLASLVTDAQDEIQLEAIAAELNIFLTDKIVTRKRLGFVVEVRSTIAAEPEFSSGPLAIGSRPVPMEVLTALRTAIRDGNPRVGLEALYAFGTLAVEPVGAARRDLLRASGAELAALAGAPDPAVRYGALRVMARVFAVRPGDAAIEETVGDGVIVALNDKDRAVQMAAMNALGAMRYDRAVQALGELFAYHAKGELAEASLDALARIANPSSAPLFTTQLSSKTPAFRGIALEGIARIGDKGALARAQTALKSERDDGVLLALAFASSMLSDASIDPITEALARSRVHDRAKQYLVELAPGRMSLFTAHAQDPDARIRLDIVEILDLSNDASALTIVEPLVSDRDPLVAHAAAHAVAHLRAVAQGGRGRGSV